MRTVLRPDPRAQGADSVDRNRRAKAKLLWAARTTATADLHALLAQGHVSSGPNASPAAVAGRQRIKLLTRRWEDEGRAPPRVLAPRRAPRARATHLRVVRTSSSAATAGSGSGPEGPKPPAEPPAQRDWLAELDADGGDPRTCRACAGALVCLLIRGHSGQHSNGWAKWRDSDVTHRGGRS